MYKTNSPCGGHRCSCRRKRLNHMHNNHIGKCSGKAIRPTYNNCSGTVEKSTYSTCSNQMSKPTFQSCPNHTPQPLQASSNHSGKHHYTKPLILDENFKKTPYKDPSDSYTGCACHRCQNKRGKKRYMCHCYECY